MLKGSTVKEVNVCFVDKLVHSVNLINVQPEEKTVESTNCYAVPMWRFLCAKQLKNVQVLMAEKNRRGQA